MKFVKLQCYSKNKMDPFPYISQGLQLMIDFLLSIENHMKRSINKTRTPRKKCLKGIVRNAKKKL